MDESKDRYNKLLYKLFLKGIIDEEMLEKMMEEREKATKFEKNVEKAIIEVMEESYVKKNFARIYKENIENRNK